MFHLRKKGSRVALITSQNGVKSYIAVAAPLDGSPVLVDLLEQKSGGRQGQVVLSHKRGQPIDKCISNLTASLLAA